MCSPSHFRSILFPLSMEATKFSSLRHPSFLQPSSGAPSVAFQWRKNMNTVGCYRGYGGRLVDENMIVPRIRLRELRNSETANNLPQDWMEWEKEYFADYNNDVFEAVGLLQNYLMNMRPSLAFGIVALVALSVSASTGLVIFHAFDLSGLHLG